MKYYIIYKKLSGILEYPLTFFFDEDLGDCEICYALIVGSVSKTDNSNIHFFGKLPQGFSVVFSNSSSDSIIDEDGKNFSNFLLFDINMNKSNISLNFPTVGTSNFAGRIAYSSEELITLSNLRRNIKLDIYCDSNLFTSSDYEVLNENIKNKYLFKNSLDSNLKYDDLYLIIKLKKN